MAYKRADMISQSLKAIESNELVFVEEIITYVPFSKRAFYDHNLHECNEIKRALDDNRVRVKHELRKNWRSSKQPALQIALYRLLADEQEFKRLVMNQIDHTSDGEKIQPLSFTVAKPETQKRVENLISEIGKN